MKIKKFLGLFAAAASLCTILVGCGSSAAEEPIKDPVPTPSAADGAITPGSPGMSNAPSSAPTGGPGAPPPPPTNL